MDAFQLKDRLAEKLGEEASRELLSYIASHGGGELAERLARIETKVDGNTERMNLQLRLLQWVIGIGLTAIGLLVGILFKVL